jgi:ligand-binding sensor domain-containing protein/signal transduction histidine kinase
MRWVMALTLLGPGGFLAVGAASGARQDYSLRTWGKPDGLPEASISAVLQAPDHYLWVATGAGLFRFDGVRFTPVPLDERTAGLSVGVTALSVDAEGNLWVGTERDGLFRLVDGEIQRYGTRQALLDEGVTSLAVDVGNQLWIGTRHGVNRFDGSRFTALRAGDGLPDDFVSSLHAARSGSVWITTRRGMCSWSGGRLAPFEFQVPGLGRNPELLGTYEDRRGHLWAFGSTYLINLTEGKRFNYFHEEQPASMRIWSLCEGRDGRFWIGTSGGGLFCFDGNRFQPVTLSEGRPLNDVRAICEDAEGNLWLGSSEGGLSRLQPQKVEVFPLPPGLGAGRATCVAVDAFGRTQVGFDRGGVFTLTGQRFEKLADSTGLVEQDMVCSLGAGADGSLWVGTLASGLCQVKQGRAARFTSAHGLADDRVLAVCGGLDGTIWAGTRAGVLHALKNGELMTFAEDEGVPRAPLRALHAAADGTIWVGLENGGVMRSREGRFYAAKTPSELAGKPVLCLYLDSSERLWIGTEGGLGCLVGRRGLAWGALEGLPGEVVSGIVEDGEKNLWLMTSRGIARIEARTLNEAFSTGGPLRAKLVMETAQILWRKSEGGGPRALRSPEGVLWFATDAGPVAIDPQDWQVEQVPPPVRLESVLVNHQPVKLPSSTKSRPPGSFAAVTALPANLTTLDFQFTALNFTAPEKTRFRHKLEGFDSDWVESGPDRRVRYGRLPGGEYVFRVTACNSDGQWNETGAALAFTVLTPVWRAPWALGAYAVVVTGAVVGTVRLVSHRRLRRRLAQLKQQQAMERERVRIAQDMHDEIGSKLTKISFLSERAKVEIDPGGPASAKVDAIAQTSRDLLQSLDEIVWAVNPRNDTLEHLASYLAQYATEYFQDTPIECAVRLQGDLPEQTMSAEVRHNVFLAFEESLNNALKHSGASRVQVQIQSSPDQLQITVRDNGRGFALPAGPDGIPAHNEPFAGSRGNGLRNLRDRLSEIGGNCEISSVLNQGTLVKFTVWLYSGKNSSL